MARTAAYRKYQLTFNNPQNHGYGHDTLKNILSSFNGIEYWCMCDEIGEQGTPHTHLYLYSPNAIELTAMQQRFYGAHVEIAKGAHRENRDYIRKEGKWRDDPKHETNLPDTFEESGELPAEQNKRESVSAQVLDMIAAGATNAEIVQEFPSMMTRLQHLDATRQMLLEEKYRETRRTMKVFYIWGKTGVGKTRSVLDKYGYANVFHVTNYLHPFDNYKGQSVILFDEFRSSLPIADMLRYLDGYPLMLPCRYADKVACFSTVYFASNIPLEKQYPDVQVVEPETYNAFLRRIHHVFELLGDDPDAPF